MVHGGSARAFPEQSGLYPPRRGGGGHSLKRLLFLMLGALAGCGAQTATAGTRLMTPLDVAKLGIVTGAQVSPDGQFVAASIKSRPEPLKEGDGPGWTDLYILRHKDDGNAPRPYITSREAIGEVQWSADSKALTFLAKRGQSTSIGLS